MATQIAMTFEEIKKMYPNEWVILGDPELRDPEIMGSIVEKLIGGVVLAHDKNLKHLAANARDHRKGFSRYTTVFTGDIPKNRKYLL